jgi:hypothetical protein
VAYNDPQSITIDGTTTSLPRILTGTTVGSFKSNDGTIELTIDPRGTSKRRRNVARLYVKEAVEDPLTGLTTIQGYMISLTSDRPLTGIPDATIVKAATGLIAWNTATSNANLNKLVAGEN